MDFPPVATSAQSLEYGLAPPRRRRRMVVTLVAVSLILLGLAARQWGPSAWQQVQLRYYQHACLTYTAPPDQVVYEEDPAAAAKLLANRLDYQPCRWDMWAPASAKMPAPAAARILPAYQSFESLNSRRMAVPGGTAYEAILFLHERTTPTGERRLVKVNLMAAPFSFWACVSEGDRYESQRWAQANRSQGLVEPFDTRPRHVGAPWPLNPPQLHIYAGQPDPADGSHFTIRYQIWGQEDVMDGYLVNNDTVTLKPRNPPRER